MKGYTLLGLLLAAPLASAGEADVLAVKVECRSDCTFHVSLRHDDTGWDHYANQWEILTPDRKLIARRVLYHPHVDEQPFTRSLSGVKIPPGIDRVIVRARDKLHLYGGRERVVELPKRK
jgi:hypothetical protein